MKLRQALAQARAILAENNIDDASLEGEILLRHVLKKDRAQLFADLDGDISTSKFKEFMGLITRRVRGEPSAYITGHREFYGLDLIVNPHVLIPRPETELLVEKAISLCRENRCAKIADIGTGCGAIAVSLAVNLPDVRIYATDISSLALEVAEENCRIHTILDRVILLQGNMLEPVKEHVDMIIANMPYVVESDIKADYEPKTALSGGEDGLDKIRDLCYQAGEKLSKKGSLLLEVGKGQAKAVVDTLNNVFPSSFIKVERDLAGIERMAWLSLTASRTK